MAADLLVELGVEDLPPVAVDSLCEQLAQEARRALEAARLPFQEVTALSAPRRLALQVSALAERQPDRTREVRGPAKMVAFDEAGRPTRAAEGFCRAHGARVEDAYVKTRDGGEYLCLQVEERGRPAAEVLQELLPQVFERLVLPETMRWNGQGTRFIRPVRWLVGLFGEEVVPFRWAGLTAGATSRGHRLSGDAPVTLARAGDYLPALKAVGVLADPAERRAAIEAQLAALEREHKARFRPDDALWHTLIHSAEWPQAVAGRFHERFLELPPEVLATTMVQHQRFVPGFDPDSGAILPCFVGFRDGAGSQVERIRRGYERVLEARLVDSEYFFREDRKRPLVERASELKAVVYQAQLGSLWDRTQRIRALARALGERLKVPPRTLQALDRAAFLCKADLVTLMVGEFPELQGVMGGIYARLDGEPEPVARALREHYLPQGPRDPLPASLEGALLSLADKLESVTGALLLGQRPSGSRDPFGLRRAANGIVRLILERELELDVFALLREQAELYAFLPAPRPLEEVEDFLSERLGQALRREHGLAHDVVAAVLAPRDGHFLNVLRKARSLEALRGSEAFEALVIAFSRAYNLLRKKAEDVPQGYDPKRFVEPAERELWRALLKTETQIEKRLARADFAGVLEQLLRLKEPIDAYFDAVMVMCEDPELRRNRLGFLRALVDQFLRIGDLSQIVVAPEAA